MKGDQEPSTDCDAELVAAYCAGELDAERRDRVAAHLIDCERCWDAVQVSRAAVAAVQRLHEPAPAALRADVRGAISAADRRNPTRGPAHSHRLLLVAVAVTVLVLALAGVSVAVLAGGNTSPSSRAAVGPLGAAVHRFGSAAPRTGSVPSAPDLSRIGLRTRSAGALDVGGVRAICYLYTTRRGERLELLVGARAWARPAGARSAGATAWAATRSGLALIAGPDAGQDQMLVITEDHATAVTAAASLGVT